MSWPPPVDQSQKLSIDRCWLESNHRASPMSWSSLTPKLLMCCARLLPITLHHAPNNEPLISDGRSLQTSVPHLCYIRTSINFVLYKFWWLPAPLWPSNAKISPWYITFKTPSNLVKGSDADMSDTQNSQTALSAALNPSCPLHASGQIASRASKFPRSGHSATSANLVNWPEK